MAILNHTAEHLAWHGQTHNSGVKNVLCIVIFKQIWLLLVGELLTMEHP